MSNMHETNRRHRDETAENWRDLEDRDGLWRRCPQDPDVAFETGSLDLLQESVGTLDGKDICVIGSGDNLAAFALAGCGAKVTSADISQRRLDIAAERAVILGLRIEFVRSDAAVLAELGSGCFDLAVSTNGFSVWVSDPRAVYAAVHRILRPGGFYVFYDIHPFLRPWVADDGVLRMKKPYASTGPLPRTDESERYEFHWTLSDLLQPLISCGFLLRWIGESPPRSPWFWIPVAHLWMDRTRNGLGLRAAHHDCWQDPHLASHRPRGPLGSRERGCPREPVRVESTDRDGGMPTKRCLSAELIAKLREADALLELQCLVAGKRAIAGGPRCWTALDVRLTKWDMERLLARADAYAACRKLTDASSEHADLLKAVESTEALYARVDDFRGSPWPSAKESTVLLAAVQFG